MKLTKEDIKNYGTEDEKEFLKETGEMGQYDIEEGGEFYETALMLKRAAKKIQRLTNKILEFKKVYPFDKYQGPYAKCSLAGRWSRLWTIGDDYDDPQYFLETADRPLDEKDEFIGTEEDIASKINAWFDKHYGRSVKKYVKRLKSLKGNGIK